MTYDRDVLTALGDWGSGYEVAKRLGTRRYGAVMRSLHRLFDGGLIEDRWIENGRRQYRVKQASGASGQAARTPYPWPRPGDPGWSTELEDRLHRDWWRRYGPDAQARAREQGERDV